MLSIQDQRGGRVGERGKRGWREKRYGAGMQPREATCASRALFSSGASLGLQPPVEVPRQEGSLKPQLGPTVKGRDKFCCGSATWEGQLLLDDFSCPQGDHAQHANEGQRQGPEPWLPK